MLRTTRVHRFAALDACFEVHAAVQADLRVHAIAARRLVSDDAVLLPVFPRTGPDRGFVTVILEGRALVRTAEGKRRLAPGDTFHLPSKLGFQWRFEADPVYRSLVVDVGIERPDVPVDPGWAPPLVEPAETLWRALREGSDPVMPAVAAYLAHLAAAGAPFTPPPLDGDVPPGLAAVSAALDAQICDLSTRPMQVDLEARLGRSPRQVSRLVRALHRRYGFNADGWIDARNRHRLMLAAALLADPERRVRDVAAAVGYGSPQSMARAFAHAGLPAPRDVAAAIRASGA